MRHTREEVIRRTKEEFRRLDKLVANLTPAEWNRRVPRPDRKAPWTVKDVLAHITHWKADVALLARGKPKSPEARLNETQGNQLVYLRWRRRSPKEVLEWHRQVHKDVLAALRAAPDKWFTGRQRRAEWPYDLDGHSSDHRTGDLEKALRPRKS